MEENLWTSAHISISKIISWEQTVMTEGIAYCVNCKAVTIHKDGKCMFCEGENKIYDNIFHDPNVLFTHDEMKYIGQQFIKPKWKRIVSEKIGKI